MTEKEIYEAIKNNPNTSLHKELFTTNIFGETIPIKGRSLEVSDGKVQVLSDGTEDDLLDSILPTNDAFYNLKKEVTTTKPFPKGRMTTEKLAWFRENNMLLGEQYDRLAKIGDKRKEEEEELKRKEKESRYDFLPVVKINNAEEPKNAIISIKECENNKKEKINLGTDYEEDKREYTVADIVIAKNSTARIPLIIKRGYDPTGFQDGDGVLSFNCSNSAVKLNYIDNDDTDYDEGEDKYDLNDAEYGHELVLEIEAKALERGTKFSITVYASDDDDGWGSTSNRKGICGKFNVKVVEKDVFLQDEIEKMKKHFIDNVDKFGTSEHTDCITTVNAALRVLFNKKLSLEDRMTRTMEKLSSLRMVKENFIVDYLDNNNRICKRGTSFKAEKMNGSLSEKILKSIDKNVGYHVFGLAIMDGYHSLILTIDNTNLCKTTFVLSDQNPENDEYNYTDGWKIIKKKEDLDRWITRKTIAWHKSNDSYAGTLLWKLQR